MMEVDRDLRRRLGKLIELCFGMGPGRRCDKDEEPCLKCEFRTECKTEIKKRMEIDE